MILIYLPKYILIQHLYLYAYMYLYLYIYVLICGQLLVEMEKAKGAMGNIQEHIGAGPRMVRGPEEKPKTLSDMGLTYDQSSTYTYILT